MKGVSLAVTAVILMVLAAVVLLAYIYFISGSKGQIDILQYQSALRSCCGDRTKYKCDGITINCKVPWSDEPMSIDKLAEKAGITWDSTEFDSFCFCPEPAGA
ncbi:MAG: hypothetical protein V1818_03770 [Candidatus Aenigmatarchaeota archaeon]